MSEEKRNVPKLRFPGFTDPWEQRKLGELYEKAATKNDMTYGANDIISVANMYYKVDSRITDEKYLLSYNVFEIGDIAFEGNKSKKFAHGRFVENTLGNGIVSHVFDVFKPKMSPYDLMYWKYAINNENIMGRVLARSTKASTMMTNLVADDFLRESLCVPKYDEQRQIGSFFLQFDKLITLHQRKLDHLKEMKKGLLQKMFPKEGETVPEIRFPGFTDPWEQRKLGEIATIVGGGTPNTNIEEYWDGEIDWYTPAELNEQKYVEGSIRKISQLGYDNSSAKILPANKTVLFTSRAGIGNTAILRRSACTNQGFQSMVINNSEDIEFIYSLSNFIKRKAEIKASGSTFLEISGKQLAEIKLMIPSLREQSQIGSFFRQFDTLITLHQRKLDHLKEMKKGLLQQMFV